MRVPFESGCFVLSTDDLVRHQLCQGALGSKCEITTPAPSKFAAEQTLLLHCSLVGFVSLPESRALVPAELLGTPLIPAQPSPAPGRRHGKQDR